MVLTSALVIFFITFLSALFPLIWEKKSIKLDPLLSFCSGVLIATAFLSMLPAAVKINPESAGLYILVGFLLLYVMEKFLMVHPCQEHSCVSHTVGISAFIGLSLHCILTGFALGLAIHSAETIQILTPFLTAIIAHKIPESFSLSTLLIRSKMKTTTVVMFLLCYCLMTPIGLYFSKLSMDLTISTPLYVLFSVSTGTFIYIASSDILPQLHNHGRFKYFHLFLFILGVFLIYILK